MATQVTAWKAGDGSLHEEECGAATVNVDLLIENCGVDMTPATSNALKQWLKTDTTHICDVLLAFVRSCPNESREEAPSESGEGPVVKRRHLPHFGGKSKITVLNGMGEETRIPGGVYWDGENSNFYDTDAKGMGQHFFDDWYGSRFIFPQFKEDALHGLNHEGVHDFRKEDAHGE
jgi:hypothetical protein